MLALLALQCVAGEPAQFPEFKADAAREYLEAVFGAAQIQLGAAADASFVLARAWSQLGRKEEAERLARQALTAKPDQAGIHSFLAGLMIHQDRMAEAESCLRQALRLKPGAAAEHRRLGMVLDRRGDREGARKAFETAVQLAPEDVTARLLLGRLLLDEGLAEKAVVQLTRACQLDTNAASSFYVLSQAQTSLGDQEGARVSLRTFQQLKQAEKAGLDERNRTQDDRAAMRTLAAGFHTEAAGLFLERQQPGVAEAHLRQAVLIAPEEPAGHELLATVLLQAGRLAEARAVCETLVRLRPQKAVYRVNLGTVLLQLKEQPAAQAELKRALELDPQQPDALNNLARLYLGARRELPEALTLARRLVELQPTAASQDLLGWACYANGQTNDARAAAARAVELEPDNAVYRERYRRLNAAP